MIYVADGPSDVPVFSILNQYSGRTYAARPRRLRLQRARFRHEFYEIDSEVRGYPRSAEHDRGRAWPRSEVKGGGERRLAFRFRRIGGSAPAMSHFALFGRLVADVNGAAARDQQEPQRLTALPGVRRRIGSQGAGVSGTPRSALSVRASIAA